MPNPSASEIAQAVGLTVPAFFSDAFDQALQGEANYIATGEPTGAIAQIGQAVARSACRRYAANPSGLSARAATDYERACGPYLDLLDPGRGLGLVSPFQGGQCLTNYSVNYRWRPINTNGSLGDFITQPTPALAGPIRGLRSSTASGNSFIIIDFGVGLEFVARTSGAPQGDFAEASIVNVVRLDGSPDNCGSPAPTVNPRPSTPDVSPPPFRFNPVPGVDVGVDVTLNPDGSISFDIGTGDVTIDPFNDIGPPGLTPADLVPGPGSAGSPVVSGAAGDAEGAAGPGQELVGLQVEVLETTENANTFDNVAAVVYRGIGYVRMGYPGRLGLDISGGTVLAPQFFHAQQRGLTNWAVRANLGFILRITPYYREIEP